MDDFREWLSDNLRYFMLGGAILIVVLILIFAIRGCAGRKSSKSSDSEETTVEEQVTPETTDSSADTETEGKIENPLVQANSDVTSLVKQYYQALGDKDIEALREIEVNLSQADEAKITNARDYIERYEVDNVYTKEGLDENSYVAYANYNYYCKGIATAVPALSQLYIVTDSDGSLKIDGSAMEDSKISSYTNQLKSDADVKTLTKTVKEANEKAQETDPDLAAFLQSLGDEEISVSTDSSSSGQTAEAAPTPQASGETVTANTDANIRAEADGDSEVIGGAYEGETLEKIGQDGEWIKVRFGGGQEGYIYSSLVD